MQGSSRNGGRGSSWSYRGSSSSYHQELGSNISSSSGTIVSSTTYTSNASRPSTLTSEVVADTHFLSFGIHIDEDHNIQWVCQEAEEEEEREEPMARIIRSLVHEFFSASSANCSIKHDDMSVVERLLEELGVGWVLLLNLDGGPCPTSSHSDLAGSWTWALNRISETFHFTRPLHPDLRILGMSMTDESFRHARYHLALFIKETMLKMLAFVDNIVAMDPNAAIASRRQQAAYLKISILLHVRDGLSESSTIISFPPPSKKVKRIQNEIATLLSANKDKATEAIRDTMDAVWTRISRLVQDGDDSSSLTHTLNGSSDIHEATRSVTLHIRYSSDNYRSLYPIVFSETASPGLCKYLANTGDTTGDTTDPMDMLITQMISYLEENLTKMSQSFPDKGLKFLFLINNLNYILQQLDTYGFAFQVTRALITRKIHKYIQTFLQESWAPVLSCITQHRCFGKNYSIHKFESAFQRNYNTQKLWKVPDPHMRQTLRKAIVEKIISVLEDSCVSTSKFTPKNLEEMSQELFEG